MEVLIRDTSAEGNSLRYRHVSLAQTIALYKYQHHFSKSCWRFTSYCCKSCFDYYYQFCCAYNCKTFVSSIILLNLFPWYFVLLSKVRFWNCSLLLMRYSSENAWRWHCYRQWAYVQHLTKTGSAAKCSKIICGFWRRQLANTCASCGAKIIVRPGFISGNFVTIFLII